MFTLLRQRNFALLWFGGLISIMGDMVLNVALPFFVYQVSGSTLATAVMVAAELLPRLLFGSIAGVFVDRWDRKQVMVIASLSQGIVILPLFLVHSAETLWIVYLVSFIQVTFAIFFGPAENALLPLLVPEEKLIQANSLNAMNNNFARLIGPPLGGGLLAIWGLTGVVLFNSLTFIVAALMILAIAQSGKAAPAPEADAVPEGTSWSRFWKEWADGINIVRRERVVTVLFITVVMLNFGGVMIDPLGAAYVIDVVKASAAVFGLLVTVQAIGGIIGGLLAGKVGEQVSTARLFGWSEIILGLFMVLRYNIPQLPSLFVTSLLVGLPAALGIAALETLFQKNVPNTHLGRISGALNTTVGITSL
ncbi:MAG TPA: MFS transporter, partial [Anaerolineales bacterium]|nr:MFS transporter [Anaerolineales bacterium]